MDSKDLLKTLVDANLRALDDAFSDTEMAALSGSCQSYAADFDLLCSTIKSRQEAKMVRAGIQEFQRSWYQAMIANYRSAYASLRLSSELLLSSVLFSVDEIGLRRWLKSQQDINWSAIIDEENGIFSFNFLDAFDENFSTEAAKYRSLASTAYRECSEFVHGNMITQLSLSTSIAFDNKILRDWADKAESFRLCYIFVFAARYLELIGDENRLRLEDLMMAEFPHLLGIQAIYNN